jgi:hypothetical protein
MNRRQAVQSIFAGGAFAAWGEAGQDPAGVSASRLRAMWFHIVADDFVVNIWKNGGIVAESKRLLTDEIFGATVERVEMELVVGDWLVFHVVNNRLRWGGCRFFGMAGFAAEHETTIVSSPSEEWSYTDQPSDVARFISERDYLKDRTAKPIPADRAWDQGTPRLRSICGGKWHGRPIWGDAPSTWLKLRVS